MADKEKALSANVPGRFFVDTTCINCDNCRDVAPTIFGETDNRAFVAKQPESPTETELAELALLQCPRGSIGSRESIKIDSQRLHSRFPEEVEDGVFWLGYNSPKAYGGKSYFVRHPEGNWMIDGPKFHPNLVNWIEANGGLKFIFITHRDDIGELEKFAEHFGAKRIIHYNDKCAQPDAEIVLESFEPTNQFGKDFLILGTPGHTEGHCMLLYKSRFLFSGDTLTSGARFGQDIEAWSPLYCWFDFDILTQSIRQLADYPFDWLLPSHGRRKKLGTGQSKTAIMEAVKRCQEETEKNPVSYARLEVFEAVSRFATDPNQRAFYREKAAYNKSALNQKR